MAQIDRVREDTIQRVMQTLNLNREDAENFVDDSEGQTFDLDEDDMFDVDITEQVTRLILPPDEKNDH